MTEEMFTPFYTAKDPDKLMQGNLKDLRLTLKGDEGMTGQMLELLNIDFSSLMAVSLFTGSGVIVEGMIETPNPIDPDAPPFRHHVWLTFESEPI